VTETMLARLQRQDPTLRRVGRLIRTVGIAGVVAGLAAIAVGLWLIQDLDALLGRSLTLTSESLTTVDSSLMVAAESVTVVGDGLADAESTSRGLEDSLANGAALLRETARLTRSDIAVSLESFERSMPALIQVSGTVDQTLRAVDNLPVGPEYDPEEPFDETLQALQEDLDGLPEDLRDQADAIDEAGSNLARVGRQSVEISTSLADVRASLTETGRVLDQYQATTGQARDLLDDTRSDLNRRLWILRALVIVLGIIYCFGQLLPIYLGSRMATTFAAQDSVVEHELVNR
jgi:methyl-accepting chemotaxis protein